MQLQAGTTPRESMLAGVRTRALMRRIGIEPRPRVGVHHGSAREVNGCECRNYLGRCTTHGMGAFPFPEQLQPSLLVEAFRGYRELLSSLRRRRAR